MLHIVIAIIVLLILFSLVKKIGGCLIKALIVIVSIFIILKILFYI